METVPSDLEHQIAGIAALNEPVRRALYVFVAEAGGDVSRDQAAEAVGISRALAAFHLDKLVEESLLEARYQRLTGRSGPGAGRPSKLYRRSPQEIRVSLPPRRYELAARLFAQAVTRAATAETIAALGETAHHFGTQLGAEARRRIGDGGDEAVIGAALSLLEAHGFEPLRTSRGEIVLRNCPFHPLACEHRDLVCGMNLAIMDGLVDGLGTSTLRAELTPQPGRCCVAFRRGQS